MEAERALSPPKPSLDLIGMPVSLAEEAPVPQSTELLPDTGLPSQGDEGVGRMPGKEVSGREQQAKALSDQLAEFHTQLMRKVDGLFVEVQKTAGQRIEHILTRRFKHADPALTESIAKVCREQLLPVVQRFVDTSCNRHNATLDKAVSALSAKAETEAIAVQQYARLLTEAIQADISAAHRLEDGLQRFFEERRPGDDRPTETDLLQRVLAQQERITAALQQVTGRLSALEQTVQEERTSQAKAPEPRPHQALPQYYVPPYPVGIAASSRQPYYPPPHPAYRHNSYPMPIPPEFNASFVSDARGEETLAPKGHVFAQYPVAYFPYGEHPHAQYERK